MNKITESLLHVFFNSKKVKKRTSKYAGIYLNIIYYFENIRNESCSNRINRKILLPY